MVDYVLYGIVAAVVGILTLVGCVVFLIQMQHPDDRNSAWLPKLIVLFGLFLACSVVLLLPFDASVSQACGTDAQCPASAGLAQTWYTVLIMIAIMTFVFIPLAYFWYETDDEEPMGTRICTTVCWSTVNLFVFVSILLGMYFSVGYVELPVLVMQPYSKTNTTYLYTPSSQRPAWSAVQSITVYSAIQTIQTSLVIYVLALLSFIGWMLMTVFGGIGLVALPIDLIGDWYNRPRPIDLKQFAEKKLQLKKRCEELIQVGKETRDKFRGRPNRFKERRFTNKYKKMILDLEDELQVLNICYKRNQINPLIPWLQLFGGLGAAVITVSWWFQIIFEIFLKGLAGPYLSNVFLKLSDAFPLFGIVAYGVFAFYILICCVKGSIKFAGRFFLISVHPLRLNGTMMNSFLFNVGLILICSVSCTQLCTTAFKGYVYNSSISQLFVSQIQYLKILSYFYSVQVPVFYSLMFAVSFLQLFLSIFSICFCAKKQAETVQDAMNALRQERA